MHASERGGRARRVAVRDRYSTAKLHPSCVMATGGSRHIRAYSGAPCGPTAFDVTLRVG